MQSSIYLDHRDSGFPWIINHLNLKIGLEVGVRKAEYSTRLLRDSNIEFLYGIDIKGFKEADDVVARYFNRFKIIFIESPKSAELFPNDYFDFIHIDADHKYEAVKQDLEAWYPKLKKGGVFCGDDYIVLYNNIEGKYGVVEAVNEFAEKLGIEFNLTGLKENSKENRNKFALEQGNQLSLKLMGFENNFQQTPNWWFIK